MILGKAAIITQGIPAGKNLSQPELLSGPFYPWPNHCLDEPGFRDAFPKEVVHAQVLTPV